MGLLEQIQSIISGISKSAVESVAQQVQQESQYQQIDSTAIDIVAYEPMTKAMTVRFQDESTYIYLNVSQQEYDGMLNSGSTGQYFNRSIKGRKAFIRG